MKHTHISSVLVLIFMTAVRFQVFTAFKYEERSLLGCSNM